ncbi:MAG: ADP-ribosylglycohydrolase family protein [Fibrobacter sp.]|nr:ADP-ribosylglycohydrolase family protein [Fibrobacter sp.]
MNIKDKVRSSLLAAITGDALGVPVEFTPNLEHSLCSVKNMFGYGRYDQPQGTWSDDSSMMLCTIESLCRGYNIEDLGQTFCKWLFEAYWTATGVVFDAGITTVTALDRIKTEHCSARNSGSTSEHENGNGSLMRILPAALFFYTLPTDEFLKRIHEISAITHAHPRTLVGCGIYSLLLKSLFTIHDKQQAFRAAISEALQYYGTRPEFKSEISAYLRIISFEIFDLEEEDISSSGYIVDTLEAALWCFLKNDSTQDIILSAVNIGLDTDTAGTIAGGLAGLVYGIDDIPSEWISSLSRKNEIDALLENFATIISSTPLSNNK